LKPLSPSSRLVFAVLVFTFVLLSIVGALRPHTITTSDTPAAASDAGTTPSGEAAGSVGFVAATSGANPSAGPSATAATASPAVVNPTPTPKPTVTPTQKPVACKATDQDRFVYHPSRLDVQAACIRVTGTVEAVRREADGDLHILLALDPAYSRLLTPANQGEELGDLVVEPVCVRRVTQTDAIQLCRSDSDPFSGPFPVVGETVWMEGRYVLDLQHGSWAELHPLYRWGDK
jgi:hypothetical protein